MDEQEIRNLRANQRFLVWELQRRGITVEHLDYETQLLEARLGRHRELFVDIDSSIVPFSSATAADNKLLTKLLLERAGLAVPAGAGFLAGAPEPAIAFARSRSGPLVVKPRLGSNGSDVYMDILSEGDLLDIAGGIAERNGAAFPLLIEEQFAGLEYRIFLTSSGQWCALHRQPAFVVGDGKRTIRTLAEDESHRRTNPRRNCLGAILLDEIAERHLARLGLSLASIPGAGEKVFLRGNTNVSTGGSAEDATELVHPSAIALCETALSVFPRLPYAGIDFLTTDIAAPQGPETYRILELNTLPGLGIHMAPAAGPSRDVARMVVDAVFPETAARQ